MKNIILILGFFVICSVGVINSASTTGRTTQRTTGRTTQRTTGRPTPRTTPRPRYINCYVCQTCPRPFPNSYYSQAVSTSGWCVKMSVSELPQAEATRGIDAYNFCTSRGCSWRTVSGVRTYLCCCNGNLCNTAVSTSKLSILTLLLSFLIISFFNKKF